jgi:hypothetical protein
LTGPAQHFKAQIPIGAITAYQDQSRVNSALVSVKSSPNWVAISNASAQDPQESKLPLTSTSVIVSLLGSHFRHIAEVISQQMHERAAECLSP